MAKALLLPGEEEIGQGGKEVDGKGVKQWVREHLRKNGVGRRLCVTKQGKGTRFGCSGGRTFLPF